MTTERKTVMIIGGGGREHATVHSFLKSKRLERLYVAPGNDGMFYGEQEVDPRLEKTGLKINEKSDALRLAAVARDKGVDLVFVGPEKPLSLGVVDVFESQGLAIIGPSEKAARLEGSKAWAKDVMFSLGIPVPKYAYFDNPPEAENYIKTRSCPVVVKADGLAAGKGSIVTDSHQEAVEALDLIMVKKKFGDAGNRVVIEERLDGREFSFFAFTDGKTVRPMAWARDYKPAFDGDAGPNTGGMGAFSPYREEEDELTEKVMERIALPLVYGCREQQGFLYKGILYIGGTFLEEGRQVNPYVFEINVRMGDPEAQAIYPRLETDIVSICVAIAEGSLDSLGDLSWDPNYHAGVCAVSGRTRGSKGWYEGYPGRYAIGREIRGLENVNNALIFHSGTKWDQERHCFLTDGGRVLTLVASDPTLKGARKKVYQEMRKIDFEGMRYRTDIGQQKGK